MTTAAARFLSERVLTASPLQRVVMLYDRALLDLDRADVDAEAGRPAVAHLLHAIDVVAELRGSLDVAAWEGGPGLADLYAWVMDQLLTAVSGHARADVEPVRVVLTSLRSSWAELATAGYPTVA